MVRHEYHFSVFVVFVHFIKLLDINLCLLTHGNKFLLQQKVSEKFTPLWLACYFSSVILSHSHWSCLCSRSHWENSQKIISWHSCLSQSWWGITSVLIEFFLVWHSHLSWSCYKPSFYLHNAALCHKWNQNFTWIESMSWIHKLNNIHTIM